MWIHRLFKFTFYSFSAPKKPFSQIVKKMLSCQLLQVINITNLEHLIFSQAVFTLIRDDLGYTLYFLTLFRFHITHHREAPSVM